MSGTIQNRESFLDSISESLGRPRKSTVTRPEWKLKPQYTIMSGYTQDQLVEALAKQCPRVHTKMVETDTEHLADTIRDVVMEFGGKSVIYNKDERFDQFGLTSLLTEQFPAEQIEVYQWSADKPEENIRVATNSNVGITISDYTLAQSGTVVMLSTKEKGRSIHFLPENSIMLIPKSTLLPRMTQAAVEIRKRINAGEIDPSCINFITGPSNSADIELELVVGVHGPVKVSYIVINDK